MLELLCASGIADVTGYAAFPASFDRPIEDDCLVVLDLVLGAGVDGVQALERLAAAEVHQAPVMIVSGQLASMLGVVESYGQALGLNIVATIEKPIPPDAFQKVMSQMTGDKID
jgi:CheY-like chemotaxis protein